MRTLLMVQMDVEAGNRAISDGSLGQTIERAMGELQPEAAYFTTIDGKRTALIVFDLKEESQIPSVAEPFFRLLNASIRMSPVMTAEDVRTGLERAGTAAATG
jgi:hypothetical protein